MRDVNFGVQVSVGFVGRVVSVASAFLGSIAIARIVGPGTYGQFYVLLGVVSILDNPLTGWAEGARKRMTESQVSQREAAGAALLPLVVGLAVILIASLVLYVVETDLVSDTVAVLLPIMFLAVASFTVSLSVIKGTGNFGGVSWLQALDDLVRIGGQIGLIVAGYGLGGMVGGFVAAKLLLVPVIIKLSGVRPQLPDRELLAYIWQFAKHSIPGKVVGTALGRMDILLLGAFASAAAAGQYQVAMNVTTPAMFLTTVAAPGVVNRVSNLDSRDEAAEICAHVQRIINFSSVIALPIFVGCLVLGRHIVVTAYGSQYDGAAIFVAGLAAFQLIRSQASVLTAALNGIDRPGLNLRYSTVQFVLNIVLGVALLETIGPIGIVIATVIAVGVRHGLLMRVIQREIPVRLLPIPVRQQLFAAITMGLLIEGILRIVTLTGAIEVIGLILVGAVTYGVCLLLTKSHRDIVVAVVKEFRESTAR